MSDTGYLKGQCQNCGGHLEFPAAGIGTTVDCPHCGVQTTLISNPPEVAAPTANAPARSNGKLPVLWGFVVLILILAAAGTTAYWFKRPGGIPPASAPMAPPNVTNSESPQPSSPAPEANDLLQAGPVTLQKTEGSAL